MARGRGGRRYAPRSLSRRPFASRLAQPRGAGSRARTGDPERAVCDRRRRQHTRGERGTRYALWLDWPGSARTRTRTVRAGGIQILYEDAALIVVNKPPGLLTVPLPRSQLQSVQALLAAREAKGRRPFAVHRIDCDTSGIVLFAKTPQAQRAIKEQFAHREPERVYVAIVHGHPARPDGTWRDHLAWDAEDVEQIVVRPGQRGGAEAITHYRVTERLGDVSVLEVRLETGKRNQIRVQAAAHGHPLVGERRSGAAPAPAGISSARQALHAARLTLRHPVDGRTLRFEAPLPADLQVLLRKLRQR